MSIVLALCVIGLTLVSASLTSDFIVLFSEHEKRLEAEYGSNFVCYIVMFLNIRILCETGAYKIMF